MSEFSIGGRLLSVAKFVRQGAKFADVGTDHAYLPVFLLRSGTVDFAVCSDINEGPLENARKTVIENGVGEKVALVLSDGAENLVKYEPTDIAICGMGGELIARIIEDAPYFKRDGIRLILQPMTRQEQLREYLNENGFTVLADAYSTESGKSYLAMAVEYTAATPDTELCRVRYGRVCVACASAQREYLEAKLKAKRRALDGISAGGGACEELSLDIRYIEGLISELELIEKN